MNDNPFESLPPVPDDLWPKVPPLNAMDRPLGDENFPVSLPDMAGILGRGVHLEMESAGEYAAKAAITPSDLPPDRVKLRGVELRFHSRLRAESAARLLNLYQAVYKEAAQQPGTAPLPAPAQLKEAATKSYQTGFRDEMSVQRQIQALKGEQPGFNDELYSHLKKKPPGEGPKLQR
jgi:hypothetical protein